ncbi:hypothetical protein NPX13_g6246 [Xylaria arbuscula]|uniref:Uncharacterized protein n=1 Tax=Xylaria arbuscula TaxID=114810 RepID=A0A9W8NCJ1_9PEZI|nr:hypothetical protein NPX13_g6246 [Xylaria arbuscula]
MSVALIIGVGEAVGRASAEKFAAAGYKVAVASRSQRLDPAKFPFFKFDAAEPTHVASLFEKVSKEVGVPSVVIYNGNMTHEMPPSESASVNTNIVTLTRFLTEEQVKHTEATGDFTCIDYYATPSNSPSKLSHTTSAERPWSI